MVLLIVLSQILLPQCLYYRGRRQWLSIVAMYSLIFATSFWAGYYSSVVNSNNTSNKRATSHSQLQIAPCQPLVLQHHLSSFLTGERRNDSLVSWVEQIDFDYDDINGSELIRVPYSPTMDISSMTE